MISEGARAPFLSWIELKCTHVRTYQAIPLRSVRGRATQEQNNQKRTPLYKALFAIVYTLFSLDRYRSKCHDF
jgi:hypothetical protein